MSTRETSRSGFVSIRAARNIQPHSVGESSTNLPVRGWCGALQFAGRLKWHDGGCSLQSPVTAIAIELANPITGSSEPPTNPGSEPLPLCR